MNLKEAAGLAELAARLQAIRPNDNPLRITRGAVALWKLGRRAHRLAERRCNGELTEEQEERAIDAIKRAFTRIRVEHFNVQLNGMTCTVNGDPRGAGLKLHHPMLPGNTWGGQSEGYAVGLECA